MDTKLEEVKLSFDARCLTATRARFNRGLYWNPFIAWMNSIDWLRPSWLETSKTTRASVWRGGVSRPIRTMSLDGVFSGEVHCPT